MKPFQIHPIFFVLALFGCARQSSLSIRCPDPQIVEITALPQPISALNLQGPELTGACSDGGFSYRIPDYEKIYQGKNTLTYIGSNNCGDEGSCLFVVNVIIKDKNSGDTTSADYRTKFIGNYVGFRDCYAVNTPQTQSDQDITMTVQLGPDPDKLLVGDELVPVDTTGAFPYDTFYGYRSYKLKFRNDSIFLTRQWGNAASNETCYFKGKKL